MDIFKNYTSLEQFSTHIPKTCYPSPADWRDEIFYLIIADRFSDGKEDTRPLYKPEDEGNALLEDGGERWRDQGLRWQGGTFNGIRSKLDYIKNLGATTLWLTPVLKQRVSDDPKEINYHGYAIQNFLETDPRFGTKQELRELVDAAHAKGLRVILDVVHNHTGNNWSYRDYDTHEFPYYRPEGYSFGHWRTSGNGEISDPEDAVWPVEFQNPNWYWMKGAIKNWDNYPEYEEGDFFESKSLRTTSSKVLDALIKVYRYWIYVTDCDGFRIDAVKHFGVEQSRRFCNAIVEYAELIGKKNFILMGEVAGSEEIVPRFLADMTGHGLNAVLDINGPPRALEKVIKGFEHPFELFKYYIKQSDLPLASYREVGKYHVSILDDQDQVWRYPEEGKGRFCAGNPITIQAVLGTGFQMASLGIPTIYYGTEQGFDGAGYPPHGDRYVRECMFGGEFGAKRTRGVHFFNPENELYKQISQLCNIRRNEPALRYGRMYFRKISFDGQNFNWPDRKQVIAWSRILAGEEILCAINTDAEDELDVWVIVENELHDAGVEFEPLFSNSKAFEQKHVTVEKRGIYKALKLQLSGASMLILKRKI